MEGNKTDEAAGVNNPERVQHEKTAKGFTDRLGIKDENAGQNIKDTADKMGVVGSIGALIMGFLVWTRSDDLLGFLIGFVIAVVGIYASFVLVSLLYSYSDMINISVEQSKILKRLEARSEYLTLEDPDEQQFPAEEQIANEPAASDMQMPSETDQDDADEEQNDIATNAGIKNDLERPSEAVSYDKMKRVAHYSERADSGIICPVCLKWQTAENDICFYCRCQFIFDDEQPVTDGRTA